MRIKSVMSVLALCAAAWSPAAAQERAITIVDLDQPELIDPCHLTRMATAKILRNNVIETLVSPQTSGPVQPLLAVSWDRVDDLTWRFKLRDGVKFHDGKPFNAAAVVSSVERIFNAKPSCHVRDQVFSNVGLTVTPVDDLTVDIKTSAPTPILPTLIGAVPMVSPDTPVDKPTEHPVGTGPYVFGEWMRGQRIVLRRAPEYWGEAPQIEQATYVWRSDSSVIASMVQVGEADLAPQIATQDATNAETDFAYLNLETTLVRIGLDKPPLDDARVRRALKLAIDREAMRGSLFPQDAITATQIVVPGTNGYNEELKAWEYDPEQAKKLLAEAQAAGVDISAPIDIIARQSHFANSTEVYEAVAAMWMEIGLNVNLSVQETGSWVTYWVKPFNPKPVASLVWGQHDNTYGDAAYSLALLYHSGGQQSTLTDGEIDKLVDGAQTAEPEQRTAAFQQAFQRLQEDVVADVPMFHMVTYARVNPRIDWRPDALTNARIELAKIKFKQ